MAGMGLKCIDLVFLLLLLYVGDACAIKTMAIIIQL